MVKPLLFKGDKKPKKRKHAAIDEEEGTTSATVDPAVSRPASTSTALTTTSAAPAPADEDDSWTSADAATDIAGPVLFVLPSDTPSCIACDANGTVFSSALENLISGEPSTAEPHDVRQVWVANRVAGTESFSFKGHHGRYLSCDKFGILSAKREAISPEESFLCIPTPDTPGRFALQTQRDTFIAISGTTGGTPEIRGDASETSFVTMLRIRMQSRFKPRLKANKEEKARSKISRKELETAVGRRLEDDEVKKLKRARRDGTYHETILDVRVKGKHDKFAC